MADDSQPRLLYPSLSNISMLGWGFAASGISARALDMIFRRYSHLVVGKLVRSFERFLEVFRRVAVAGDSRGLYLLDEVLVDRKRLRHHLMDRNHCHRIDAANSPANLVVEESWAFSLSLPPLAKVIAKGGNDKLKAQLSSTTKLAGESRGVDPMAMVSIPSMTPETFAIYQNLVKQVQAARIAGNRDSLKDLRGSAQEHPTSFPTSSASIF